MQLSAEMNMSAHSILELFENESEQDIKNHADLEQGRGQSAQADIQEFSDKLNLRGLDREPTRDEKNTLVSALQSELGDEGMAALERGDVSVLKEALPKTSDQIGVAQEYLKIAAKELNDPELKSLAEDMQKVKVSEVIQEERREKPNTLGRDRGLDDDMGL